MLEIYKLQDDAPLPAGTTFKDIIEATIAKPGRDMVTWIWPSPPELPKGPLKLSFVMLHLPKKAPTLSSLMTCSFTAWLSCNSSSHKGPRKPFTCDATCTHALGIKQLPP